MMLILLLTTFLFQQPNSIIDLPIAQVQISETTPIYPEPDNTLEPATRARVDDVRLIYEIQAEWGRTDGGWLSIDDLELESAIVRYSAVLEHNILIAPAMDADYTDFIAQTEPVGVGAIYQGWALIYSPEKMGWVRLNSHFQVVEAQPEQIDFAERTAYVKRLSINLYHDPDVTSVVLAEAALGTQFSVIHQTDTWGLVRYDHRLGWAFLEDLDFVSPPLAIGTVNYSSINFRRYPVDGRGVSVLRYGDVVLILGRNEFADWLYVRAQNMEAWVYAPYINFDGNIEEFPVIPINR